MGASGATDSLERRQGGLEDNQVVPIGVDDAFPEPSFVPPSGNVVTAMGVEPPQTDATIVPAGGITSLTSEGATLAPGGGTTEPATVEGDTIISDVPPPETESGSRVRGWVVTARSTWCPPELCTIPQYSALPTFTGTVTIDGTAWVQTTLSAPLTTGYTTPSVYTEDGQVTTDYVPVTTVIPGGTVVIRHNLTTGEGSSKVPILAGTLGGFAVLLVGTIAFCLVRRRRRPAAAVSLHSDSEIDTSSPSRHPPHLSLPPPVMSQTTFSSQGLQPTVTGSTSRGSVDTHIDPPAYSDNGHTSMDVAFSGLTSPMYASTNQAHSNSPGELGSQPVHCRSPSAATMLGHQTVPYAKGHIGHHRAVSGPVAIGQEDDPLLGPFSDANHAPAPPSVLVHEDAGSILDVEIGRTSLPPAYHSGI